MTDLLDAPGAGPPLSPALREACRRQRDPLVTRFGARPERRRALGRWLAEQVRRQLLEAWTFAELGAREEARLAALCERLVEEGVAALAGPWGWEEAEAALERALAAHRARLRALVSDAVGGEAPASPTRPVPAPPCAEYAPELQLELLGLRVEALAPPVLDLGCGEHARLVRHLRAHGVEAQGVDRLAPEAPDLVRGSWLEVPLPPGRWGSIVSHQAFSLHFLHAHLHDGARAARYARRYVEVLEALRPGGGFHYAPGLPFVERHLDPRRFRVQVRPVRLRPELAGPLAAALGGAPTAASVVRAAGPPRAVRER